MNLLLNVYNFIQFGFLRMINKDPQKIRKQKIRQMYNYKAIINIIFQKIMKQKSIRPLFQQALTAVKKSFQDNPPVNKIIQEREKDYLKNQLDQMSSGQIQRLKDLGVDLKKTKKIIKQNRAQNKTDDNSLEWKHDKYRAYNQDFNKNKQKIESQKTKKTWTIRFLQPKEYNKIYQLVKSQKAFIEEIDSKHIKFTRQLAFNTCKSLLKNQNIKFEDQTDETINKTSTDKIDKLSIFDRLK